jgi:hypothetical protein
VESGLFRTQDADLQRQEAVREGLTEVEWLHLLSLREFVHSGRMGVHRAAKGLGEAAAVPVVVPVGEQDVMGDGAVLEPVHPLLRNARVDQHGAVRVLEAIRVHRGSDLLVMCGPVEDSREDFVHVGPPIEDGIESKARIKRV